MSVKAEYDRGMSSVFLILDGSEDSKRPEYIEKMLLKNDIKSFLKFGIKEVDGKKNFVYNITSRISLRDICENRKLNNVMIKGLVRGILEGVYECERYLLCEEDILLEPEYVFFTSEKNPDKIELCYYPGYGKGIKERLNGLLGELINHLDYKDRDAVELLYALYAKSGEDTCTTEQLMKIIDEQHIVADNAEEKRARIPVETLPEELPEKRSLKQSEQEKKQTFLEKIKGFFVHGDESMGRLGQEVMLRERTVLLSDFSLFHKFKIVGIEEEKDIYIDKTPFYVGKKDNSMDFTILDDTVSRIHAKFTLEKGECYLEDLNSMNGTFVNEDRLRPGMRRKLKEGDILAFSEKKYVFEMINTV